MWNVGYVKDNYLLVYQIESLFGWLKQEKEQFEAESLEYEVILN